MSKGRRNKGINKGELCDNRSAVSMDITVKLDATRRSSIAADFLNFFFEFLSINPFFVLLIFGFTKPNTVTINCIGNIINTYPGHTSMKAVITNTRPTTIEVDFKTSFWSLSKLFQNLFTSFMSITHINLHYSPYKIEKQLIEAII